MTNIEAFVQPIFTSSFIVFKNLNLNNDEILKEFEQLSYDTTFLDNECQNRALRSNSIKILDEIKNGEKIKEKINSCLNVSIKEIWKYDVDHTIVNSWVTKTYPNCDSRLHNHKNFWLSAVYYPYSPKGFKINFASQRYDLTSYTINTTEHNAFNCTGWDYEACTGDLIVFSSGLMHKICANTTKDIRYSLAINILPKGTIGTNDSTLVL